MPRFFIAFVCFGVAAFGQLSSAYRTEDAFPGLTFEQPLGIATAPGEANRVYVLEKPGRVQVVTTNGTTRTKQPFLDLTPRPLYTDSEGGLLGVAFHPSFAQNRFFYVFYTLNTSTAAGTGLHDRLSRFTALPPPASNGDILATEVPILSQYDEAGNHNGGDLHFGPDGNLYVALGDEGGGNDQFNNSQRIDRDFFSGLLRIDVDRRAGSLAPNSHPSVHAGTYAVPSDNPFVGATSFAGSSVNPAQVRTEFWAVGLRNPWRFSFDPPTGRLFLADVGQSAREEINLITRGANYGWSYREGLLAGPRANPPPGLTLTDPIWDAERTLAGSITGGVVYRGSRIPDLVGRYVFGDFVRNRLFIMTLPASGPVQIDTTLTVSTPAGFGIDPAQGDVLIASIGTGTILRLVQLSAPSIGTQPSAQSVTAGHEVSFSASAPGASVRWQVSTDNGAAWADLSDGAQYSGTSSNVLTIANAGSALHDNLYRMVATASGGSTATAGARLTVAAVVLPNPSGIASGPSAVLFVADSVDNTLNRVAADGTVTRVAGTSGQAGTANGTGATARFNQPMAVAVSASGALFVADSANATIRRVEPDGAVTTFAGSAENRGSADGFGGAATFSNPAGIALTADGTLYVADSGSHTIRRITAAGQVSTLAGLGGSAGSADGAAASARFNRPGGVAIDASGNVYVADTFNNTIRRISPSGQVNTLAGVAGVSGAQDGTGAEGAFNRPTGIVVDSAGVVYVADEGNNTVRRITPAGVVTTIAGLPSVAGKKDGAGNQAWFSHPRSLTLDSAGNIFVADTGNAALRRISPEGEVTTVALIAASAPPPNPTPPTPTPNPTPPSSGGGGGGGTVSLWFLAALLALKAAQIFDLPLRRTQRFPISNDC